MDYGNPIGSEFKSVGETTHNGVDCRIVSCGRLYQTDANDLWEAVTDPERLRRWFLPVSGELEIGGRYKLEGNAGGIIEVCDAPSELMVTWEFGENVSWVRLKLHPQPEGTQLVLEHIISKDEFGETHWAKYGPGATGVGWDLSFFGLALHISSGGEAINPEENESWMASDGAKSFFRACAEAWGESHIASGEDQTIARAMAAETAAAYAGD